MWSRLHSIIIMFKIISIKSFITFYTLFCGNVKYPFSKSLPNEARTREIFLQNVSSYGLIFQFPLQQQIGRVFVRHSAKPQLRSFPSVRQPWNTACHPIPSFKTFHWYLSKYCHLILVQKSIIINHFGMGLDGNIFRRY